jgi:hypothetical protein
MPDIQDQTEKIRAVRRAYEDELMAKANVVGVGVGYRQRSGERTGELALVVMVDKKVPEALLAPEDVIPTSLEGVPVDVQEVGEIRAF